MKKFLTLLLIALSLGSASFSQGVVPGGTPSIPSPPYSNSQDFYTPLFNLNSGQNGTGAYYNKYETLGVSQLGTVIDTVPPGVTLHLSVGKFNIQSPTSFRNDTITLLPIYGSGTLSFCITAYRATYTTTTNPTVYATLKSTDNYAWESVSGISTLTLTPTTTLTSTVTPVTGCWDGITLNALFYDVSITEASGDTSSVRGNVLFIPTQSRHFNIGSQ